MVTTCSSYLDVYGPLLIIGTTTPAGDVYPDLLVPVFQPTGDPELVLVPQGTGSSSVLGEETVEWLEEEETVGTFQRFASPLLALAGTVLLSPEPNVELEQVAEEALAGRLLQLRWKCLQEIEQNIRQECWEEALSRSRIVLRASNDPRDSIPRLLQLALLDRTGRKEQEQWLSTRIQDTYTDAHRSRDFTCFSGEVRSRGLDLSFVRGLIERALDLLASGSSQTQLLGAPRLQLSASQEKRRPPYLRPLIPSLPELHRELAA